MLCRKNKRAEGNVKCKIIGHRSDKRGSVLNMYKVERQSNKTEKEEGKRYGER